MLHEGPHAHLHTAAQHPRGWPSELPGLVLRPAIPSLWTHPRSEQDATWASVYMCGIRTVDTLSGGTQAAWGRCSRSWHLQLGGSWAE